MDDKEKAEYRRKKLAAHRAKLSGSDKKQTTDDVKLPTGVADDKGKHK